MASPRPDRASVAGLALALALEGALVVIDVVTPGDVIFTSAYLIAPLALALFADPRIVAATGGLSIALAIASGQWNDFLLSADHVLRCCIVSLAALLALLSSRARHSALEARAETEAAHRDADSARERLNVMLGALAEAVTVHDEHGKTVYANEAAVRLLGAESLHEVTAAAPGELGARFAITLEDGSPVDVADLPGRRAVLGEPAEPMLTHSVDLQTGDAYWLLTKVTVVGDETGRPLAVNIIEDVTAVKETELRQRFLAEAGRLLASSLEDCERTLARVARLAVPVLGDWCAIDLVDERDEIVRVALAHADPEKVVFAERLSERYPEDRDASSGVAGVVRSGTAELHPRITDEMLRAGTVDDEHFELIAALGMRSAIVAPMRSGTRTYGVITLVTSDSRRALDADDLAFVEDLALRAGAAVENARLYAERVRTAQTLQDSLLPRRLPELEPFRTATSYRAGGAGSVVGGDFYDLFAVDGGAMVLLGDVTGKGVGAAAMTALVRHTAKTAARFDGRPSAVLRVVDEVLREQPYSLVTVVCARLRDTAAGAAVELASGGHPLPLLIDRDGGVRRVGRGGLVLGAVADGEWSDHSFALAPGETLLFYTDGATDAPGDDERFGDERLQRAAAGPGDPAVLVARIDHAIERFQGEREGDDRALLAIQYAGSAVAARSNPA